jgi:hypothetical protein
LLGLARARRPYRAGCRALFVAGQASHEAAARRLRAEEAPGEGSCRGPHRQKWVGPAPGSTARKRGRPPTPIKKGRGLSAR